MAVMKPAVSDLTYLKRVTNNDPAMMRVFIASYLQCAPDCIKKLEESCAAENWPMVKKAAHDFKPQINYMGLSAIVPLIQEVEDRAAEEVNLDTLQESVRQIATVSTLALEELREALLLLDAPVAE